MRDVPTHLRGKVRQSTEHNLDIRADHQVALPAPCKQEGQRNCGWVLL